MSVMGSQITSLTIVHSTVYSGANQRKHQSSASLSFVGGIHWWPVNFPHKGPVTRKMFPFGDVIMSNHFTSNDSLKRSQYNKSACRYRCIHYWAIVYVYVATFNTNLKCCLIRFQLYCFMFVAIKRFMHQLVRSRFRLSLAVSDIFSSCVSCMQSITVISKLILFSYQRVFRDYSVFQTKPVWSALLRNIVGHYLALTQQ